MSAMTATKDGKELVEKSFIHYLPIVIVGILICGVPSAILNSCAGIFYPVMAQDFGVPVSQISMWRTIDYITGLIATPFIGVWFAKTNSKAIIFIAAALESLMFIVFGVASQVWMLYIAGAIAGVTNGVMLGVGIAVIMNRWFRASTGLVIGICTAFTDFGGLIFTPIGQAIIESSGWRTSYITLGIISIVIMIVGVAFLMSNRPEDRGMLPYGTARAEAKEKTEEGKEHKIVPSVRPKVAVRSYKELTEEDL